MDNVVSLTEDNVRPLIGYVLVRRIVDKETEGGIVLPDISKDMPRGDGTLPKRGTVLKLGECRLICKIDAQVHATGLSKSEPKYYSITEQVTMTERVPFQVQVGDTVHFNKYGGRPFTEDEDLLLIHEREILAVEEVMDD